jgi:hypothetical protein
VAKEIMLQGMPVNRVAALVIIGIWVAIVIIAVAVKGEQKYATHITNDHI